MLLRWVHRRARALRRWAPPATEAPHSARELAPGFPLITLAISLHYEHAHRDRTPGRRTRRVRQAKSGNRRGTLDVRQDRRSQLDPDIPQLPVRSGTELANRMNNLHLAPH